MQIFAAPLSGSEVVQRNYEDLNLSFERAKEAYASGRPEETLEYLKNILAAPEVTGEMKKGALRLLADCYLALGLKKGGPYILSAVEKYKDYLKAYPDPERGNDEVYRLLAFSYEQLKFYYEGISAWEQMGRLYPQSPYVPLSLITSGMMLYKVGRYEQAIRKFTSYLQGYPKEKEMDRKKASFALGLCYFRSGRTGEALRLLETARKKWSILAGVPEDLLYDLGVSYFRAKRYEEALDYFSLYVNLYPRGEKYKDALLKFAQSAKAAGKSALAVKIFSRFIEKNPQEKEVEECLLSIADMGVEFPQRRFPRQFAGMEAYYNPLALYDSLLKKYGEDNTVSELFLRKGRALEAKGEITAAIEAYQEVLRRNPKGERALVVAERLNDIVRKLLESFLEKGDYLAAADLYLRTEKSLNYTLTWEKGFSLLQCLKKAMLYGEAKKLCRLLANKAADEGKSAALTLTCAQVDFATGEAEEAMMKLEGLLAKRKALTPRIESELKKTLGDLYFHLKRWEEAQKYYEDYLLSHASEGRLQVIINYGVVLLARGETKSAISVYLRALKDFKLNRDAYDDSLLVSLYMGLGEAYFKEKNYREGILAFKQALPHLTSEEDKSWVSLRIGRGLMALGSHEEAKKFLSEVKAGDLWPKIASFLGETIDKETRK